MIKCSNVYSGEGKSKKGLNVSWKCFNSCLQGGWCVDSKGKPSYTYIYNETPKHHPRDYSTNLSPSLRFVAQVEHNTSQQVRLSATNAWCVGLTQHKIIHQCQGALATLSDEWFSGVVKLAEKVKNWEIFTLLIFLCKSLNTWATFPPTNKTSENIKKSSYRA